MVERRKLLAERGEGFLRFYAMGEALKWSELLPEREEVLHQDLCGISAGHHLICEYVCINL